MYFCKVWRMWLKKWARHAHLDFELPKGVAASIFESHPPNFDQMCIFYMQTNDVFIICLYLLQESSYFQKTDFFHSEWPPRCTICTHLIKIWRVWLKNWGCHALGKFKIEMGVAGSFFKPQPPNLAKVHNFPRCTYDINMILISLLVSDFQIFAKAVQSRYRAILV